MNKSRTNRDPWTPSRRAPGFPRLTISFLIVLCVLCSVAAQAPSSLEPGPKPADIAAPWKPWIGEYGSPGSPALADRFYLVAEKDGMILLLERRSGSDGPHYKSVDKFTPRVAPPGDIERQFQLFLSSKHERLLHLDDADYDKVTPDANATQQVLIKPVKPIAELRAAALATSPPAEKGTFRKPDLVELAPLDAAIHLEIRYATANDFLGTPVYTRARAFMQRPAAEALVQALKKLQAIGYGLLIHDAYRPWYVTKIFWDATPPEGKIFVADPSQGSRHNRGCAVDLTLYDLASGKPIEMPGTYDEMSPRSFPDYPGGTSLQRWHRDLLRRAMESEGFTVYEHEWWHFDYQGWHEYPILNIKFEDLNSGQGLATAH
jgi:zinc D-Ala-D-Ala dipeptidase